ncbi:MAG: hypothetical protein QXJ68_01575 [Methanocellales archaeon]
MGRKEVIQEMLKLLEKYPDKAPHLPWGLKNCPMCRSDCCKWISKCRARDRYLEPPYCKVVFYEDGEWNIEKLRQYLRGLINAEQT